MMSKLGLDIGVGSTNASEWPAFAAFSRGWARDITAYQLDDSYPIDLVGARKQLAAVVASHEGRLGGKPWGWKLPRTYALLPFLFDALPDMRFIHVVRDGRDMALSHRLTTLGQFDRQVLPRRGPHQGAVAAARAWSIQNCRAHEQGVRFLGDRYLVIRHEDFLDHTTDKLTVLAAFAEISPTQANIDEALSLLDAPGSRGRHKSLSRTQQRLVTRAAREGLEMFGYVPVRTSQKLRRRSVNLRSIDGPSRVTTEGFGELSGFAESPFVPTGLLVVGMSGSGTSVATQISSTIGLHAPSGDLLGPDRFNRSGYWESRALSRLNDLLLTQWRSNWWLAPPNVTSKMVYELRGFTYLAAQAFIGTFTETPWLWKDPRLTVMLPFWDEVLGKQPVVFVHRNPLEVAGYLQRRDGFGGPEALAVWERHSRLALAALAGRPVCVMSYEDLVLDADSWRDGLQSFCQAVGLSVKSASPSVAGLVGVDKEPPPSTRTLSESQRSIADLLRELQGRHRAFPEIELPPEGKTVSENITALWRRTLRHSPRTYRAV